MTDATNLPARAERRNRTVNLSTGPVMLQPVGEGTWEWWVADHTGRAEPESTWYRFERVYVSGAKTKHQWLVRATGRAYFTLEAAVRETATRHRVARSMCYAFAALTED